MNKIENANSELNKRPTVQQVDDLAHELCTNLSNHDYFKWYCAAIWKLGEHRVRELSARVRDAKDPARLLTKLIKEDLKIYEMNKNLRKTFGGK
jgi:hypothetical protein